MGETYRIEFLGGPRDGGWLESEEELVSALSDGHLYTAEDESERPLSVDPWVIRLRCRGRMKTREFLKAAGMTKDPFTGLDLE
jgi:hypothetical protein